MGALTSPFPCFLKVLVLEINKVLLPAKLTIQGTDPVSAVTLSLLEPQVNSLRVPSFLSPTLSTHTPTHTPFLLTGGVCQLDPPCDLHLWDQVRDMNLPTSAPAPRQAWRSLASLLL